MLSFLRCCAAWSEQDTRLTVITVDVDTVLLRRSNKTGGHLSKLRRGEIDLCTLHSATYAMYHYISPAPRSVDLAGTYIGPDFFRCNHDGFPMSWVRRQGPCETLPTSCTMLGKDDSETCFVHDGNRSLDTLCEMYTTVKVEHRANATMTRNPQVTNATDMNLAAYDEDSELARTSDVHVAAHVQYHATMGSQCNIDTNCMRRTKRSNCSHADAES